MGLNRLDVTRYPNGVNNSSLDSIFSSMPFLDPTKWHIFHDDFDRFVAADWTITTTEAGGGNATEALTDADGGVLLVTNDNADDDADFFQKVGESFLLASGKRCFFRARMALSDVVQSDFVMGLQITDATPLDVSDGVFFLKVDGSATVDFIAEKNGAQVVATDFGSLTAATYETLGFYWDGISRIYYELNGTVLGYITPSTSLPDDEVLTVSFGLQNGEAAAKTLSLDYIFAANER